MTLSSCEDICEEDGGTCVQSYVTDRGLMCYVCREQTPSSPSSRISTPPPPQVSSSSSSAVMEKSCAEICAENEYDYSVDYSSYILGVLNQYTCVSSATVRTFTATISQCPCTKRPEVSVDTTPSICRGTRCGDVVCGSSASCTEGNTTYTVSCNWSGWEDLGNYRFQPKLDGQ
jgi:hypothetical protein